MMDLYNSETEKVLTYFQKICQIPRCSEHEEEIRNWLKNWALSNDFTYKSDNTGNLLITIPPSLGFELSPTITLQCHMDMVCEKNHDSMHNFKHDPISTSHDGEWLVANNTTLGADNGIGMAIAMTISTCKTVSHPTLELLFTVDEESGLIGVSALKPKFFTGMRLINLDTEDVDSITIGCAGGVNTHISIPISLIKSNKSNKKALIIEVGGLTGGHSGVEIHNGSANAIKVLMNVLDNILERSKINLSNLKGGTFHNVIPSSATCEIHITEEHTEKLVSYIKEIENKEKDKYKDTDSELFINTELRKLSNIQALSDNDTRKVINYLCSFPHGVEKMSEVLPGVVETSNNLALVHIEGSLLKVLSSQRSLYNSKLDTHSKEISQHAEEIGGTSYKDNHYSAWQPDYQSFLVTKSKEVYSKLFPNSIHTIEVIHAGLECGVIGEKYPDIEMISIGPTIKYPHTPNEKLHIPSINKFLSFFIELLKELK